MPVLTLHLAELHPTPDVRRLVERSARAYADVLGSPADRIRVLVHLHDPALTLVGGEFLDEAPQAAAPYFEFVVLAGRPPGQRTLLAEVLADLIVENLGVRRELVRGRAVEVAPADWSIAGVPAGTARATEIAARAAVDGSGASPHGGSR